MSASKVLFIVGAGPRVGASLATRFAKDGYKIAVASRSAAGGTTPEGYLSVKLDVSKVEEVAPAFELVKKTLGAPSVLVYNAAGLVGNADPLAITADELASTLTINITSAFAAAQELVRSRADGSKVTFIYTGNKLNVSTFRMPFLASLGVGKSGAAHLIEEIALVHTEKNALFYYADERKPDGSPAFMDIHGDAAAEFYLELAQREKEDPGAVLATWAPGVGYKKFE